MTDNYAWKVKSLRNTVLAHVSDYNTSTEALYEYLKNLEEVRAQSIHIDIVPDERKILVYGDGNGLDDTELDRISQNIGESDKGRSHFGLGILAFMRFASRMLIISHKGDDYYWLSCKGENDTVISDIGRPRKMSSQERKEHKLYINKLRKWPEGTITVLEGVGEAHTSRFDNRFDIKKEFEKNTVERDLRRKCGFRLKTYSCFLKYGSEKPKRIKAKIGHGKHLTFTIPSKKYPYLNKIGGKKNIFQIQNRTFELRITFDVWIGIGNDGDVRISERSQNALDVREALGFKLHKTSIFKSGQNKNLLQALIDLKIIPLDKGEFPNVYSGSRRKLLLDGAYDDFGNCLVNAINYGDYEVVRPVVEEYVNSQTQRRDERSSKDLQRDMDAFFRDNTDLFEQIVTTANLDNVDSRKIRCPKCGLEVSITRGPKCKPQTNHIYAWEDSNKYVCGNCGNVWEKRSYTKPIGKKNKHTKPKYQSPQTDTGTPRKQKHGYGFSYDVTPFGKRDDRRFRMAGTKVQVSSDHPDYRSHTSDKSVTGKALLKQYQRMLALTAIIRHESKDLNRDQYDERLENSLCRLSSWNVMHRKDTSDDLKNSTPPPPPPSKTVSDLANKWSAKINIKE